MGASPLEIADIFRAEGQAYRTHLGASMPKKHRRAMCAIEVCRTAALGGHVYQCDRCGRQKVSYNSCRNRHCPKCQGLDKAKWVAEREKDLLPVGYFHLVFTLPSELRPLVLRNPKLMYNLLFRAASETLRTIAKDPKHLGVNIGFIAILHTWGQNLLHHPHLHLVVPGGGLDKKTGQWIHSRKNYFLPVQVLSRMFRGKFLSFLRKAYEKEKIIFPGVIASLSEENRFHELCALMYKKEWVIYSKPPFGSPKLVLRYLGRYTHRVAISNQRLVKFKEHRVTFRWKDYAHQNKKKSMTLDADEFIRRFLLHILPERFVRIRYYGLLSHRNRKQSLLQCRVSLGVPTDALAENEETAIETWEKRCLRLTGFDPLACPHCSEGKLFIIESIRPPQKDNAHHHTHARAPP